MKNINRQQTNPVNWARSNRNHPVALMTSLKMGKSNPLAFIPMFREDALLGGIDFNVEMLETAEILANPVNFRVTAYLWPWLAAARFQGSRDQFDRSYMGQPKDEDVGAAVVPFFEYHDIGAHGSNAVYKAVGLHGKAGDMVNTMYLEAYNAVWNYRAKNRSPQIVERPRLEATLAPAFWQQTQFEHMVPDFDQAQVDGEIALSVINPRVPVRGIGLVSSHATAATNMNTRNSAGEIEVYPQGWNIEGNSATLDATEAKLAVRKNVALSTALATNVPDIYAELQQNGLRMSLSKIAQAKKTQAFAKIREQFAELDDEYIIDMMMSGMTIPDEQLKRPILLADETVRFGQAKRYATNSGNLAESAVSGACRASIRLRVPRLSVGGVIVVIAEPVPEQLFERQRDPFFHIQKEAVAKGYTNHADALPEALRDYLDDEKVDIVQNGAIDTSHATPAATFAYEPLNAKYNRAGAKIGGKFYRPAADAPVDDVRRRFYAVEAINPSLSTDFFVVSPAAIHNKPFLDTAGDPIELAAAGNMVINGNTQFGGMLVEATNNYQKVMAQAPTDHIVKA